MTTAIHRGSAWRAAIVAVPLLLVLGGLAARLSGSTDTNPWFQSLVLPVFQPPGPVFGIAWSIFYTLMGVSVALVWAHKGAPGRALALGLFVVQLAINLSWSPVFFKAHLILPALAIIGALFVAAAATTWAFGRVSRLAMWLMVPYLVWIVFASVLNARVLMLNPTADAFQLGV